MSAFLGIGPSDGTHEPNDQSQATGINELQFSLPTHAGKIGVGEKLMTEMSLPNNRWFTALKSFLPDY